MFQKKIMSNKVQLLHEYWFLQGVHHVNKGSSSLQNEVPPILPALWWPFSKMDGVDGCQHFLKHVSWATLT